MVLTHKVSFFLALVLASGGVVVAQEHAEHAEHGRSEHGRPEAHGEAHPGPSRYQRVTEPEHWNERPSTVDRGNYQHN